MHIQVNSPLVETIANALVDAAKSGTPRVWSDAQDMASQCLLGKPWEQVQQVICNDVEKSRRRLAYSGALPCSATVTLDKPIKLLLSMSSEHASPSYLVIDLLPEHLSSILKARTMLLDQGFRKIELDAYAVDGYNQRMAFQALPEYDSDAHFNLQQVSIEVHETHFCVTGSPKHTDYYCKSARVNLRGLKAVLENKGVGLSCGEMVWLKSDVLWVDASLDEFSLEGFLHDLKEHINATSDVEGLTQQLVPTDEELTALQEIYS